MEHLLLKVLRFDVAVPTINVFCDRFLKEAKADDKTISLAMVCSYLLESWTVKKCNEAVLREAEIQRAMMKKNPSTATCFPGSRHFTSLFRPLKAVMTHSSSYS